MESIRCFRGYMERASKGHSAISDIMLEVPVGVTGAATRHLSRKGGESYREGWRVAAAHVL